MRVIYSRIRDFREDSDLTQKQLAEYLRCSQQAYSQYECGDTGIPIDVLKKLAVFYNTSVDYLVELTDNPRPYERKRSNSFQ